MSVQTLTLNNKRAEFILQLHDATSNGVVDPLYVDAVIETSRIESGEVCGVAIVTCVIPELEIKFNGSSEIIHGNIDNAKALAKNEVIIKVEDFLNKFTIATLA